MVVAWSRGGGTQDHAADVLYLTGLYTHQPFVPDLAASRGEGHSRAWRWRAAGHAAAVVEIGGPVSVVVDGEQLQGPRPAADAVVVSADPVETVAELVEAGTERSSGREPKRVGLLGGEALAARWARHVAERLGGRIELVEADELSWALRRQRPNRLHGSRAADTRPQRIPPPIDPVPMAADHAHDMTGWRASSSPCICSSVLVIAVGLMLPLLFSYG